MSAHSELWERSRGGRLPLRPLASVQLGVPLPLSSAGSMGLATVGTYKPNGTPSMS